MTIKPSWKKWFGMFRIREIYIWNGEQCATPYILMDNTFVYGPNSKGKTALAEMIDYILGSHENLTHDGLDNITHVGALLTNDKTKLWVKRSVKDGLGYFYKRTKRSAYTAITYEAYRDLIGEIITDQYDQHKMDVYKQVFEENPSYRSFVFLNFIDEKNQGDLLSIFTRGKDLKNFFRIPDVMQFLFNYDNIEELYKNECELQALKEHLSDTRKQIEEYHYFESIIDKTFKKLHLEYSHDFEKDRQTLLNFSSSFKREKKSGGRQDLIYLSKASFALSDELKKHQFMKDQTERSKDRKRHASQLLEELKAIAIKNPEYKEYVDVISNQIREIQDENILLSLTDYDSSIKKIEQEKEDIDKELAILRTQAEDFDYESTLKDIAILEDAFDRINPNVNINGEEILEEQIKDLNKRIKELKASFDKKKLKEFNKTLTEKYLEPSMKDIDYVAQDMELNGFSLEFEPQKQQIIAKRIGEEEKPEAFLPGSMARCNHIQMLFYLVMLDYLQKNFNDVRVLPILVIDSADQPINKSNFDIFYPYLRDYATDIGVQLIFISKEHPDYIADDELLDISNGLNPFHNMK